MILLSLRDKYIRGVNPFPLFANTSIHLRAANQEEPRNAEQRSILQIGVFIILNLGVPLTIARLHYYNC